MLGRLTLAVAILVGAGAFAGWHAASAGAQTPATPPALASPFPAGQAWLITCGYALPDGSDSTDCGHSGTLWNRYALDVQRVGGPNTAKGQPVLAAADGRVRFAGWEDNLGWHVLVDHGDGYTTVYAHMLAQPPVLAGEHVATGTLLGLVGCTGRCSGAHIHFALWHNGVSVPPEPICGQRGFRPGQVLVGCAAVQVSYFDLIRLAFERHYPLTPAVADFDGDGGQDAALVYAPEAGTPRIDVISSQKDILTADPFEIDVASQDDEPLDVSRTLAGDFDGDGRTDFALLAAAEDCGVVVRVFLAGDDRFAETDPDGWWSDDDLCIAQATDAVSGDYNGDGRADLALMIERGKDTLDVQMLLSNGARLLASPEPWWHGRSDRIGVIAQLLVGDFNDDGRTDLAAFGPATYGCESQVQVFLSSGAAFDYRGSERWWYDGATCAYQVTHIAAGDFDGDGYVDDLALLDEGASFARRIDVLVSDGEAFERGLLPWWYEIMLYPPTRVRALLPADFDRDGRTDLALLYDDGECETSVTALSSRRETFSAVQTLVSEGGCADAVRAALP